MSKNLTWCNMLTPCKYKRESPLHIKRDEFLPFLCEMFVFRNGDCLSVRCTLWANLRRHGDITHVVLQVREAWLPLSPHSFQRRPWMRWSDRPCRSCRRPCRRPSARLTRWSAASGPRWSARWPRPSGRRPRTLSPLSTSRRTPARYAQTIQGTSKSGALNLSRSRE